jgi:hypothetical protein
MKEESCTAIGDYNSEVQSHCQWKPSYSYYECALNNNNCCYNSEVQSHCQWKLFYSYYYYECSDSACRGYSYSPGNCESYSGCV